MDSRQTPSSPPAEDFQENPQTNEVFQADESFTTAPTTFPFPGPAPATAAAANAPRLGPNELDLDWDPYADLYDPDMDQLWRRQARIRRARSLDISPTRRNPDELDDSAHIGETATPRRYEGTNPQVVQQPSLEQQLAQVGSYNYLPLPTNPVGRGNLGQVSRGAGQRPNMAPWNMQPVRGHAIPRAGLRSINPQAYVPPQQFPDYMAQQPTRSGIQRDEGAPIYPPLPRPQQTRRQVVVGGLPAQFQHRPQIFGPPPPHYRGQQASIPVVPPGDVVRRMQSSQQLGQQGNVRGAPYGAQIHYGYSPQGPRLPVSSLPAANVEQPTSSQRSFLPGPYRQGTSNRAPRPAYGETGYYPMAQGPSQAEANAFIGGTIRRQQIVPTGPVRPVRGDSPPPLRTPLGRRSHREEATERTRKRRRHVEDESDDGSMSESLVGAQTRHQTDNDEEDDEEDQSGSIKQPSRRARPATKKAKTSGKKKAGSKGQPSKRAPKVRIDHGELVQRDDGSFWFRANDSATWEPTVRHEPNRRDMLADARRDAANPGGPDREYDVAPRAGTDPLDRTSYFEAHRHWYCRGSHDWHHQTLDPLFYRFQRGDRPFRDDAVGPLRWRGNVVLNNDNEVITGWPDMPLTLSTRIEGWRLEAIIRLDERVSAEDFRDRMMARSRGRAPQGASALGNHRSRFREENGLASWDSRDGTSGYTQAIRSRLTAEQRANNTTQGFDRLSPATIRSVRDENRKRAKGSYAKRAGHKALTDKERAARAAGEKPTRTPMHSKPPKKAKEVAEGEPSPDPEARSENSEHHTSEDDGPEEDDRPEAGANEGETGNDSNADNSTF